MKAFMIHMADSPRTIPQVPFTYEIVEPLKADTPCNSLNSTVIKILKDNPDEPVFIMEDDVSFTEDFDLNYLQDLMNNKPHESVDYITTGSIEVFNPVLLTDNLLWMTQFQGTQGVIYYPGCVDKLQETGHIDSNLYCNCKGLLTVPFLTIQDGGDSTISGRTSSREVFENENLNLTNGN